MVEFLLSRSLAKAKEAEEEAKLPTVVPELLNEVLERERKPTPWERTVLPAERVSPNGRFAKPELVPV